MSNNVSIVGAGMAGLLAGNLLRGRLGAIYDSNQSLPNNHSAVLRFRSSVVSDALNIPFRKVKVLKDVHPAEADNNICAAMSYSRKTNGNMLMRSILTAGPELVERYIAPPNLIEQMAQPIYEKIEFDMAVGAGIKELAPVISTMPMPALMKILGYDPGRELPLFVSQPGINIIATFPGADAYFSLYVPSMEYEFSRVSMTGDQLIIEIQGIAYLRQDDAERCVREAMYLCGLRDEPMPAVRVKKQQYAKIAPIDEDERRRFIMWASDKYGIYSFGRYATWRPGLLLDDLVHDFRVVMKLINGGTTYDHKK